MNGRFVKETIKQSLGTGLFRKAWAKMRPSHLSLGIAVARSAEDSVPLVHAAIYEETGAGRRNPNPHPAPEERDICSRRFQPAVSDAKRAASSIGATSNSARI